MKIFKIFGIDIKLHFTWWFVFALIAWSLSSTFFPQFFPNLSNQMYWIMGITASLLLFVSVLLHELSHSLVAKAKHIKVESITLFFFGGVAGITKEDMKPSSELQMALAGPIFSLMLAGIFYLIYIFNGNIFWTAITYYLWQLNLILAIFNLIPGYPLDGGRAFRALLYMYYKDLRKATKIAVSFGRFFAGVLIFFGIFGLISGVGSGLWFIFLGGFLYFIGGVSYEQVIIKEVLGKIKVSELIDKKFVKLSSKMLFSDFVKKYENSVNDIFIVKDTDFFGIINLNEIRKMPFKMQQNINLKQISLPMHQLRTLNVDDSAYDAFKSFAEQGLDLLPVIAKGKLLGVITKKKVLHRLVWDLKFGINKKFVFKVKKNLKSMPKIKK